MKTKTFLAALFLSLVLVACKEKTETPDTEVQVVEEQIDFPAKLDVAVVNSVDPVCGMEMPEFLKDTITYKEHVYGFCSPSCKDEFSKKPDEFIASLEKGTTATEMPTDMNHTEETK